MASAFGKSASFRAAIPLCLFVGVAALMLGASHLISATAATSPPQVTTPPGGGGASPVVRRVQSNQEPSTPSPEKQKNDLLKANFEKMKHDAGELADLAKALQQELDKSNENILSLDVVAKADKIEKLAKRIKVTARGF